MAKGRIKLPPKKNIGKAIKSIIKQGPKASSTQAITRGVSQSFVQLVQKSKIPKPTQNQRGRVSNKDSKDLTR